MKIKVRFFARYRELAGQDKAELEVETGITAAELQERLGNHFPKLRDFTSTAMLAVNDEFVEAGFPLKEGDEVAFLPPVSGG